MIRLDLVRADAALLRDCASHERTDRMRLAAQGVHEPALTPAARRWLVERAAALERFLEDQPQ